MDVRIIGVNLPGRRFDDSRLSGIVYEDVQVGVQRGRETEQLAAGDADSVAFELALQPAGDRDARGPYAQGKAGERFVYLVWVAGAQRRMFRRAKLMLQDIPDRVWEQAQAPGRLLEGTLGLTDGRGGPVCARVKPGLVRWESVER